MSSSSIKKSVLLIGRDAESRKVISEIICSNGMDVVETATGKEGLNLYHSPDHQFNIVISGLMMTGISGGDIAQHNFKNKKLPIIICSTFSDAKFGLKLLGCGVHSYIVKPVDAETFPQTIKDAITFKNKEINDSDTGREFEGNLSEVVIDTALSDLVRINNWMVKKIGDNLERDERTSFLNYAGEFLLNAHEHGNLAIGEVLKEKLLTNETFDLEVGLRESHCDKKITVAICVIKGEIALSIRDEGNGFDFEKYIQMTEVDLASRVEMLNGRGIFMGRHFFDSVEYFNGGSKVVITKRANVSRNAGRRKSKS